MKSQKHEIIRLNANENFYGCSPKVFGAVKGDLKGIYLYPAIPIRLEEKLAEKCRVDVKNVVVGGGSVRLIDGTIQTFVESGEGIIIFEKSFIAYEQLAAAHRRKYLFVKQTDFICDINNIFQCIDNKTKLIFIANPNNPTGTIISHARLKHLLECIPEKILVVIDEAYGEYVTDKSFPDSVSLFKKYPNLIILRTFSKIYGLAGLRIGYGIMREGLANSLKKDRIPFFFNSLSENAALTALEDNEFISACAKKNKKEREYLYEKLKWAGLNVIPSQGNFLYVNFNSEEEKRKVFSKFSESGLLVCDLRVFGQERSLRITVGDRNVSNLIVESLSN